MNSQAMDLTGRRAPEQTEAPPPQSIPPPIESPNLVHLSPTVIEPAGRVSPPRNTNDNLYLNAARLCAPRWRAFLGPALWMEIASYRGHRGHAAWHQNYLQMTALAAGVLCEIDPQRPDKAFWMETIRAGVVQWQRGLADNGTLLHHVRRGLRSAPVAAYQLVRLLGETTGYQSDEFITDLRRHLCWLLKHRFESSWVEACLVGAAVEGAVIIRDTSLLQEGRGRLDALLRRQDQEGWFSEGTGPDIGRLSLTIDILARLLTRHGSNELLAPLERAIEFLQQFVQRDATAGGCYGTHATAFVSPYGIELLAGQSPKAARLAHTLRQAYETFDAHRVLGWSDELSAVLGSSLALTAAIRAESYPAYGNESWPRQAVGVSGIASAPVQSSPLSESMTADPAGGDFHCVRWPRARLIRVDTPAYEAVSSLRNGGAVQLRWRNGAQILSDPGVIVLFPQHVSIPARRRFTVSFDGDPPILTYQGRLEHARRIRPYWFTSLWRQVRQTLGFRPKRHRPEPVDGPDSGLHVLPHDYFHRQITFQVEGITIRDRVQCHRPCEAIVLESPLNQRHGDLIDRPVGTSISAPLYLEGGKTVTVTREYRTGELTKIDVECE